MDAIPQNTKNKRINLRIENNAKILIERAATFEGTSVSQFILSSALAQAEKTVQENEVMALNHDYSKQFFEALSTPVRFNRKLNDALQAHDQRVIMK